MLFASVGEVLTRISIALCDPLCGCSGLSPVVSGEYCNERTNERCVHGEVIDSAPSRPSVPRRDSEVIDSASGPI
jgi:hypothetical protein